MKTLIFWDRNLLYPQWTCLTIKKLPNLLSHNKNKEHLLFTSGFSLGNWWEKELIATHYRSFYFHFIQWHLQCCAWMWSWELCEIIFLLVQVALLGILGNKSMIWTRELPCSLLCISALASEHLKGHWLINSLLESLKAEATTSCLTTHRDFLLLILLAFCLFPSF